MRDRRFALRFVGVLPENKIARPQSLRPPIGIGNSAENSPDPFEPSVALHEIVLLGGRARQFDALRLAQKITRRVRAIHAPRGTLAGRSERSAIADALRLQSLRLRHERRLAGSPDRSRKRGHQDQHRPPEHAVTLTGQVCLSNGLRMTFARTPDLC